MARIKASLDDPLSLEVAGHCTYDMYPERRGNLFSDEVYRLTKANDASFVYNELDQKNSEDQENALSSGDDGHQQRYLPPNHKFSNNDVILLTLQPRGSGDYYEALNLPTSSTATSIEGRVIATGPTYIDVAIAGGMFESAFGPAPNNYGASGRGDPNLRLRSDRFFSNIPYTRMVGALTQLTAVPDRSSNNKDKDGGTSSFVPAAGTGAAPSTKTASVEKNTNPRNIIQMDDLFKEAIILSYSFTDPESLFFHDDSVCDIQRLVSFMFCLKLGFHIESLMWCYFLTCRYFLPSTYIAPTTESYAFQTSYANINQTCQRGFEIYPTEPSWHLQQDEWTTTCCRRCGFNKKINVDSR